MSDATTMLEAVETAIVARLSGGGVQSMSVNGRNIQYMTLRELQELRRELRDEVSGGASTRSVASFRRAE